MVEKTTTEPAEVLSERAFRSVAKAVTWRVIGTLDTFILSLVVIKFLGPFFGMEGTDSTVQMATVAGYIAAAETVTKIIIYSAHDQVWNKIQWGVSSRNGRRHETYRRTTAKMTTWRILASLDTMLLAWIFTGNLAAAFSIGSLEVATKLVLYFFHERAWQRVTLGLV